MPPTSASFFARFDSPVAPVTSTMSLLAFLSSEARRYRLGRDAIKRARDSQADCGFALPRTTSSSNEVGESGVRVGGAPPVNASAQPVQLGGVGARAVAPGPGQRQAMGPVRLDVEGRTVGLVEQQATAFDVADTAVVAGRADLVALLDAPGVGRRYRAALHRVE